MRLILVRHGETNHNAADLVQGQTDSRLSDRGRIQAKLAGRRLLEIEPDVIYFSDLERARQTAAIINSILLMEEEIADPRVREQHFGVFEQRPIIELLKQMAGEKKDFATFVPPGGESRPQFEARIMSFFTDIRAHHQGRKVLVVTHYGVINILLGSLLNHEAPLSTDWQVANGSITIFDVNGDGEVDGISLNDTAHLVGTGTLRDAFRGHTT